MNSFSQSDFKANGGYDVKIIDSKPFSMIEVDEVITNIVNDEIDGTYIFASEEEEEEEEEVEILFNADDNDY